VFVVIYPKVDSELRIVSISPENMYTLALPYLDLKNGIISNTLDDCTDLELNSVDIITKDNNLLF
jgi:hypothetical protein